MQDVDFVVLEFTLNEHPDEPFTDPQRQGYEQLVRKLLQLPGRWADCLLVWDVL